MKNIFINNNNTEKNNSNNKNNISPKSKIYSFFKNILNYFNKLFNKNIFEYDFTLNSSTNPLENNIMNNNSSLKDSNSLNLNSQTINTLNTQNDKVFPSLDVNLEYIQVRFNTLINSDVKIREFTLNARNKQYNAFIVYIDGMINQNILNDFILKPLMLKNSANSFDNFQNKVISEVKTNNITVKKVKRFNIIDYIYNSLLPQNSVEKLDKFDDIINQISAGDCALFIDTLDIAFNVEVKGFNERSLSSPNNEIIIRGSQVGFTENLRTNTSLIRRYINNENLIIESINVGKLSKTPCSICYLKNIANSDLIAEVKYRISNLSIDYLISSGQLEQLIEDNNKTTIPQIISTERPDRTANLLFEGRIAIIVNGSPYVLIVPAIFSDFLVSPEDFNLKHQYSNFTRFLRTIALIFAFLLPGLYIAITNFHQELIPTELLYTIISARETVPFPILFEILIMEFSFELIREASIRVPSPVGPTIRNCWSLNIRSSCC